MPRIPTNYQKVFTGKTLTRHVCKVCGQVYYVRASYSNCPKCKVENFFAAVGGWDIVSALGLVFKENQRKAGLTDDILKLCLVSFPFYTFDGLKAIWEDFSIEEDWT